MSDDDKVKKAQGIYDAVLNAFPNLRKLMINMQNMAREKGYVETILGRRRHIPEMQLPEFEFVPMKGYVNPDVDPLDVTTLVNKDAIPERIVQQLTKEFKSYKYFGQVAKRTKELYEHKIRVINNRTKINDGSRQCVNSVIQGSAADQTKMAMLMIEHNEEWKRLGGRVLVPVHDELIAEVPAENWERGGELLSQLMCDAASFLPFPSKCDVTTTYRWYGLEYPCPYTRPKTLQDMQEDEIKWVQYMLVELGYVLPVLKEPDGSKPRGDAAVGVNGKLTDDFWKHVTAYKNRYSLTTDEEFIDQIFRHVDTGSIHKQGE